MSDHDNNNTLREEAVRYAEAGYFVVPLKPNSKRPLFNEWTDIYYNVERIRRVYTDDLCNIGLALGHSIEGVYVYAVDVDTNDQEFIDSVKSAIGVSAPAKFGQKGATFFVGSKTQLKSFKLKTLGNSKGKPVLEFLASGAQTVMPPSVHPDTGEPYRWLNRSLLDTPMPLLPMVDESTIEELNLIVKDPDNAIVALGHMTWAGVGGGGDTHDTCVSAVASMVARGWTDEQILRRIERAKKEAVERAGDHYDWPEAESTIEAWIASARAKGFDEKAPSKPMGMKVPKVRLMSEWVLAQVGGVSNLWKYNGELRRYKNGFWPSIDKSRLASALFNQFHDATGAEIDHAMKTVSMAIPGEGPFNTRAICFQNGTYDISTEELREWRKEDRLLLQMPFDYSPEAVCPNYDAQMTRLFRQHRDESYELDERTDEELAEDSIRAVKCFEQFAGLSLVDDMGYQKALFIRGSPGGGKSVLTELMMYAHGSGWAEVETVSAVSLSELDNEKIRTALIGKLLNVCSELDTNKPLAVRHFKAISGGDPVDARYLYENVQSLVRLRVRFITFCNDLPSFNDPSGAIERRMIVLPSDNPVAEEDQIPEYFSRYLKHEFPGIFNRWMVALKELYATEKFTVPNSSRRAVKAVAVDNDQVRSWVQDRVLCDVHGKPVTDVEPTPTSELYTDFLLWAESTNRRFPLSSNTWGRTLIHLGIKPVIVKQGGRAIRCRRLSLVNQGDF